MSTGVCLTGGAGQTPHGRWEWEEGPQGPGAPGVSHPRIPCQPCRIPGIPPDGASSGKSGVIPPFLGCPDAHLLFAPPSGPVPTSHTHLKPHGQKSPLPLSLRILLVLFVWRTPTDTPTFTQLWVRAVDFQALWSQEKVEGTSGLVLNHPIPFLSLRFPVCETLIVALTQRMLQGLKAKHKDSTGRGEYSAAMA